MEKMKVDLLVIGSGASGQKAAIAAAKLGKHVVIVEKDGHPGGACLNTGTIPSKSLREAIIDLTRFHEQSFYGKDIRYQEISINDLNFRLNYVLQLERRVLLRQFRKNGIRLIHGHARFLSPNEVLCEDKKNDLTYQITADKIFLGVGSKPRNPIEVPFDDEVILDSRRLLTMTRVPKTMLVLGGGVIGSEYASFFAALGTKVTVIDKKGHMLPHLDREVGTHLQTCLTNLGLKFLGRMRPSKIDRVGDQVQVCFEDGSVLEAETLLYALGRVANVDDMDLDKAGIPVTSKGYIDVNKHFQTATPHIYAAGDVTPGPALASTSMEQGRLAARHAFGLDSHEFSPLFPLGIYTIPEISTVGKTEDELAREGIYYEVGRAYYYEVAKGHITGSNEGLLKILFHAETLKILGVHIIGRGATELIHIGQMAMHFDANLDLFVTQVFNYPTFAEGYRIAALNGMNKIAHLA